MALSQLAGLHPAQMAAEPDAPPVAAAGSAPSDLPPAREPALPPSTTMSAWQQAVRRQWLLGRIAELRRQPAAAAAAFNACRRLLICSNAAAQPAAEAVAAEQPAALTTGSADHSSPMGDEAAAEQPSRPAASDGGVAVAPAAVADTANVVHLRGCAVDAIISAEAIDAKLQVCRLLPSQCMLLGDAKQLLPVQQRCAV